MTLAEIVSELADKVELRARDGKHFGVVLIPEGLVEFIPQVNALLKEIATARRVKLPALKQKQAPQSPARPGTPTRNAGEKMAAEAIETALTPWAKALLDSMPSFIRRQLLLESQVRVRRSSFS